jgi:Ca-activated chloride channel homolog
VPGRHRSPRHSRRTLTAIAIALALLVGIPAGIFGVYRLADEAGCEMQTRLSVAAAPEIVPAMKRAAATVGCVNVEITAADPANMAATLADRQGAKLAGVGQPTGDNSVPDVWIPDSSTWIARLSLAMPELSGGEHVSIARSPVVVAMPEPVAATVGWPAAKLTWAALLQQMTANTKMKVGTVEPTRDAAALSGLLAFGAAAQASPGGATAATAAQRALAAGRSVVKEDLLARFPRSADNASVASGLGAAALSEQAVIAYNAAKPPVKLAALYVEPAPVALDYPFAVLPGGNLAKADAASALQRALQQKPFLDKLAADGLRAPDGTIGPGFGAPTGAPAPTATAPPSAGQRSAVATAVDKALSTWVAVTLPARMLAIIDVSGSMLQRVPTAGNATRAQVTSEAARRGLGLFDDSWAVGLWTFSTTMNGNLDYVQQVPIGPLSAQRTQMLASIAGIQPNPQGDTGLYDTILAGYQEVKKEWDPGRVNSIVMMTDGDNDDPAGGVSHEQLLAQLKQLADPKQPIQVIIIGIGPDVNSAPLEQITKTTGGGVFIAEDPAKIGEIFLKAISLRASS